MKYLPIQSRENIATQIELDGPLLAGDGKNQVSSYASTGSTGTPVKVYTCPENAYYNEIRSAAQYFFYNLNLDENCVSISPVTKLYELDKRSKSSTSDSWTGPLGKLSAADREEK